MKIITKKASVSRIYLHHTRKVPRKKRTRGIKIPRSLFRCVVNTEAARRVDCGGISPYIFISFCGVRHSYERNLKMFCFFPSFL